MSAPSTSDSTDQPRCATTNRQTSPIPQFSRCATLANLRIPPHSALRVWTSWPFSTSSRPPCQQSSIQSHRKHGNRSCQCVETAPWHSCITSKSAGSCSSRDQRAKPRPSSELTRRVCRSPFSTFMMRNSGCDWRCSLTWYVRYF